MKQTTPTQFEREMQEILAALERSIKAIPTFEDNSEEAQAARKERAEYDEQYFFETYMPHYLVADPAPFHYDLDKANKTLNIPISVCAPRGGAKTTRGFTMNGLHEFIYNIFDYHVLTCDTQSIANLKLKTIKMEIEKNPRILEDFGDLRGAIWAEDLLINSKNDAILQANGFGSPSRGLNIMGRRPSKHSLDDLENKQSARSEKQSKKRLEFILYDLLPSMCADNWCFIWYGTVLSPFCAFKQFRERQDDDGELLCNNITIDVYDENGESFWPSAHPIQLLKAKERLWGDRAFNQEMRHHASNPNALFKRENMMRFSLENMSADYLNSLLKIRGGDPTEGVKDFAAIVTIGFDSRLYRKYLLQVVFRRIDSDEFLREILRLDQLMKADTVIESNLFRGRLVKDIRKANEDYGLNRKTNIYGYRNMINKDLRILELEAPVREQEFYFDPKIGDTKIAMDSMEYYPQYGKKDFLDALQLANSQLDDKLSKAGLKLKVFGERKFSKMVKGY